ncbi:flagellar motor protein MotB [Lamprobacter modestohalophilus]|uniref:Flagellar motor protein MotB n=1 Tax=Lamprobacter modestohalophilus TaxID=1064514 RepID=A0A9X0W728_9GAMM|nr:OmpA family protein [Lamprobacter modestohalophilus]MBK1617996.1 flagellar motor protein MotB [Lamprobacter modestohalophilus]MCF7980058.1 OmpA family protein [Chromatiaceae bacterium]MCF7995539.1 OmpA family protein [Chromatiaceae bacterium]MCF8016012.1 OmpA family protein [Chromatiaceae bacterium]
MFITTKSLRSAAVACTAVAALFVGSAAVAQDLEESYWYAAGDRNFPDGQLWATSYGECWQSAYPDGPNNLPPCEREIIVPAEITVKLLFEFDKYQVPETVVNREELAVIDEYIAQVQGTPVEEYVTIVGHTDAKGSDAYNMALGMRRADAVRSYFIAEGYPARLLAPAESLGKRDLLPQYSPFSVEQRRVVITKVDQ